MSDKVKASPAKRKCREKDAAERTLTIPAVKPYLRKRRGAKAAGASTTPPVFPAPGPLGSVASAPRPASDDWEEQPRAVPPLTLEAAKELARYVAEGQRRFEWTPAECDYVRGIVGIVRARAWLAGKRGVP